MTAGRTMLAALAVAAATILVHASSLAGAFVYDDHRFIEHNHALADLSLVEAFTDPATASAGEGIVHDIYRPLRTVLFSIQYRLFVGDGSVADTSTTGWHWVSVLLHALNAVLVLRVLLGLMRGALLPASAGALLFGVHPITSESVAWISSQGDLLAMTLLLGSLIVLEGRGIVRTLGGAALFFLACLAKESAFMLPLLLPLRDLALPRSDPTRPSPWARTTWIRVGVLAALAGVYLLIRQAVLPGLAQVEHAHGSVFATARAMADGVTWYLRGLLLPIGFTFDTRLDVPVRWTDPEVWVGLGVLGTVIAGGVYGLRTRRYVLAFACLGALVALGPVSNVIVPLKTFVADRFFYPGLLCAAAGLMLLLSAPRGTLRAAALTVTAAVLVVFGVLTADRNAAWATDASLWHAVREDRPWNANAYQGIAFEAARKKRIDEAENAYATYLEANPSDAKSMLTMGNLFGELAEGLRVVGTVGPGEELTTPVRRKQARVAQIELYRRAFEIWNRPGGLALGRGSPELVLLMMDHWITAALDLGDLRSAKFANDRAIEWASQGNVDVDDPQAVARKAPWVGRWYRAELAFRAVRIHAERRAPRGMQADVVRTRTTMLQDAGLDPDRSDEALRTDFIARFKALEREAVEGGNLTPPEDLYLYLIALELGRGNPDGALQAAKRGLSVLGKTASTLQAQYDALTRRPR